MTQQLSDQSLREKAQRIQALLTRGNFERLPDGGRMLLATLDAIHREQARRQAQGVIGDAGSGDEDKEEAERAEAEVMAHQLSDQSLREKAHRIQALLTSGILERLPDRGRKLLATLVAFLREQDRRQARGGGGGEVGSGDEEKEKAERADAEVVAQRLSDQSLLERSQRIQALLTGGTSGHLPDRGRKLRITLDAIHWEQVRRQARGDGARTPGNEAVQRIVRLRCIESSGLHSDLSRVKVSVTDFMSSFGTNKEAGINISSLEIKGRSPKKPSTSIENKGKLCEEKDSCEASSQPMNSFHEELHLDTSESMGKTSSGDASNSNGHNRMWEGVPKPSRKRMTTTSRRSKKGASKSTSSPSPPSTPQPPPGAPPPAAPPQVGFPGFWPRSGCRNRSGHSPQGTQSPNMWGYPQQGRYVRGYPQQGGFPNSIGREAAKAQRKGKRKVDEVKDSISMLGDNINKIAEIKQERKHEKVTEAQLEISRNQLKTAMEQKEAKLLEAYTSLLVQDTSQMTEEAKATRDQALASLTQKLFGKTLTAT